MKATLGWLLRGGLLGILAFAIFGPLANLVLWAVAIQWYYPHKLPLTYGFRYWYDVFKPTSDAFASLGTSIEIATITVIVCLLLAIPAGYALGRRTLPGRGMVLLILFTASLAGNYQISAITALILLVPSIAFMLLIERFLNTEMLAKVG